MIKALLLLFEPVATWDKIVRAQRSLGFILLTFLIPLLAITAVAEGYGLMRWGEARKYMPKPKTYTLGEVVIYEVTLFIITLIIVFVGAKIVKMLGETFHGRNTFTQAFTAVAYGLSPLFTMRLLDVFPSVHWVIGWGIGIALSMSVLYYGIPKVMLPDPPHAFGFFLMSSIMLAITTGMLRFICAWYLRGEFASLEKLVSDLAKRLPF